MPEFSKISKQRLLTCDGRLRAICDEAIKVTDFMVVCGHRSKEEQEKAFIEKKTKLRFPNSKHNSMPSKAVDLAPVKYKDGRAYVDWNNLDAFKELAGVILSVAKQQNVKLRWGGDWNMNGKTTDERFIDMPHYELID